MKIDIYVWNKYDIAKTYVKNKIIIPSNKFTTTHQPEIGFAATVAIFFLIKWKLLWINWQVSGTMATRAFGLFWSFLLVLCVSGTPMSRPIPDPYSDVWFSYNNVSLLSPTCDLFSFLLLLSHCVLCIAFSSSQLFAENYKRGWAHDTKRGVIIPPVPLKSTIMEANHVSIPVVEWHAFVEHLWLRCDEKLALI